MNSRTLILLLLTLSLFSCTKKVYDSKTCNELSMLAYKGYPNQSREFKDNCAGIEIKYTKELCQKALSEMMAGTPLAQLKQSYGAEIEGCFTENDLKNFNR